MLKTFQKINIRVRLPFYILFDKILKRKKPRIVILVVNNTCNLDCKYCFGEYGKRTGKNDFSTEYLKKLVDDLCDQGTIYLTVHGGEALLRKDIGEILQYMKRKGLYVNFITNGILLKQKFDEIKVVDSFCVSLDGRKEGHDQVRGNGAYDTTIEAINLIKSSGIPLRLQSTLTKHTRNDIHWLAEFAKEKKCHLEFSLLFASTPNMKDIVLDDDETHQVIREIISLKKRGYPIYTSQRSLKIALDWPYTYGKRTTLTKEEVPRHIKPIPCGYSRHKFTIDADGRAIPCFAHIDRFKALNIKEVGVKKALDHVSEENNCVLCPFLTMNDWNIMMSLSPGFLIEQSKLQLREILLGY